MFKSDSHGNQAHDDREELLPSVCLPEDEYHSEETEDFFQAITNKEFERVQSYLQSGMSPNAFLTTVLMAPDYEDHHAEVSGCCKSHTALTEACRSGDLRIINLLLDQGAQVNTPDCLYCPLNTAIICNNLPLVQLLIAKGANPNLIGRFQEHALLKAISFRETSDEIIAYLINLPGINLEFTGGKLSPLMAAAYYGRAKVIAMLCDKGVGLEITMQNDMYAISKGTALTIAIQKNRPHACEMLLHYGANINNPTVSGVAPIVLAADRPDCLLALIQSNQAFLIKKESLTQAVEKAENNPNTLLILKNFIEKYDALYEQITLYTPIALPHNYSVPHLDLELLTACQQGDFDSVSCLLEKGADPNAATILTLSNLPPCFAPLSYHATSALSHACKGGLKDIATLLIEKGAQPNRHDCAMSALSAAIFWSLKEPRSNFDLIDLLLTAGADINALDIDSDTALLTAIKAGDLALVAFLFERGATLDRIGRDNLNAIELCASLGNFKMLQYFYQKDLEIRLWARNAFYIASKKRNSAILFFLLHIGVNYHISEATHPNSSETRQFANARLFEATLKALKTHNTLEALPEGSALKKLAKRFLLENLCERDNITILLSEFEVVSDLLKKSPKLLPYFDEIASYYLSGCINQPTWGFLEISGWAFIAAQCEIRLEKGIKALAYLYTLDLVKTFVEYQKDISLNFKAESACILLREIYKKIPHHPDIFPYIPEAIPFEHYCAALLNTPLVQEFIKNTADKVSKATDNELLDYVLLESRQLYQLWAEMTLPQITETLRQNEAINRDKLQQALLTHIECERVAGSDVQEFEQEELKSLPIEICGLYFTSTSEKIRTRLAQQSQTYQQRLLQEVTQVATDYFKKNKGP